MVSKIHVDVPRRARPFSSATEFFFEKITLNESLTYSVTHRLSQSLSVTDSS